MEVAEAAVAAAAVLEAVPVEEASAEAVPAVDFMEDVPWVAQGLQWGAITGHRCIDPDPPWVAGECTPGGVIPAADVWEV